MDLIILPITLRPVIGQSASASMGALSMEPGITAEDTGAADIMVAVISVAGTNPTKEPRTMSIEDNVGWGNTTETCVVCGKGLRPGEALATMHQNGSKLPICCPLCLEAYQKDPKSYLERLARRTFLQELKNANGTPPSSNSPLND